MVQGGLPTWARENGAQKLREETERYRGLTGEQRFAEFLELQRLADIQLRASPFGEKALNLNERIPPFVAALLAAGAKERRGR